MFALARPLHFLCNTQNARINSRLLPQPVRRVSTCHGIVNRVPAPQRRAFTSASAATSRNASFTVGSAQTKAKFRRPMSFKTGTALAGLGLASSFAAFQVQRPPVLCEGPETNTPTAPAQPNQTPQPNDPDSLPFPPPPRSSLKLYELGFGTVAGICAGVFIKKGAKALAFLFGGVFVLLQYLAHLRFVKVNWSGVESRFQDAFYSKTTDATGQEIRRPSTVYSLWRWLVDFLTADFQSRATFIAGLALGLRIG